MPNYINGNPEQPYNPLFDFLYEFADGALELGEVGELFEISVLQEGEEDGRKWVDILVTPR